VPLDPSKRKGRKQKGGRIRLESNPVEVVLFEDGTKPSRVDACWTLPSVKLVIWYGGYRDVNRLMPREEWSCTQYLFGHAKLGGVTTGRFRVNVAYRAKDSDKLVLCKYEGVPAALGHITDPTVGWGKRCVRLTLESPMLENTGYEVFESEVEATERGMEMSEKEKDRRREKACKSDDAAVPVFLWNDRGKAVLDYFILPT